MKTKIITLFCASFLLLTVVDMLVPRTEANVYDNVIRLHILAQDDTATAQEIKLCVRDAVLDECGYMFEDATDITSASKTVEANIAHVESVANRILAEKGVDYSASAEWGHETYPTRVYENMTLPSGEYLSLRINLGDAEGKNWWCVLFPPLCTGVADDDDFTAAGVAPNDGGVFTNKRYIFRFKLLELFR